MPEKLTINCPKCSEAIFLDETLAGPMIAKVRAEAEAEVRAVRLESDRKQSALVEQQAELLSKAKQLDDREASIRSAVNQAIAAERVAIAKTERDNMRLELAPEIAAEKQRATDLARELALAKAAELTLRKQRDDLESRANSLDLEVARKVDEQRREILEQAGKDADDRARFKLLEKDKTISDMAMKLEEAQRKATQGSQQMQGEVLELDFESTLRQFFPQDVVESVKTGSRGGDILQRVLGGMGRPVGTLFWEVKRAQTWGSDWAAKAKQDAAEVRAEVAIIVSETLPKGVNDFGPFEGVWITRQSHAVMLAVALRQGVVTTAEARQGAIGKETKSERLYAYMIGSEFRAVIEGIALPFRELHEELLAEKRSTLSRWRRQERRIERVLLSVAGFQGDLQGIVGREMPELPGFEADAVLEVDEE